MVFFMFLTSTLRIHENIVYDSSLPRTKGTLKRICAIYGVA